MGLRGSLKDFGISEILQLINLQRRSGKLEVEAEEGRYQILIDQGRIVQLDKEPEESGERLEDYLILSGLVTPEQIKLAQNRAKKELKRLEEVLLNLEIISRENLVKLLRIRALDLIHQLFLLREGEYEFEAEPVNYHPETSLNLDTEQILMDGYRVRDEWKLVMGEVGSFGAVFKKKPGEFGLQDRLEPVETQIYRLVDGKRNIIHIAVLARQSRFDTAKILADLSKKQRVVLVSLPKEKEPEGKRSLLLPKIISGILFGVLLALIGSGIILFSRGFSRAERKGDIFIEERLNQAQEIYRLEKGSYPENLEALVRDGLLSEKDLHFFQKVK